MGNFVVLERSPHPELAEVLSRVRFAVQEGQSQNAAWGCGVPSRHLPCTHLRQHCLPRTPPHVLAAHLPAKDAQTV